MFSSSQLPVNVLLDIVWLQRCFLAAAVPLALWSLWYFWNFTLSPRLAPHDAKPLPYRIPCKLVCLRSPEMHADVALGLGTDSDIGMCDYTMTDICRIRHGIF
jgi:hypothetical protein